MSVAGSEAPPDTLAVDPMLTDLAQVELTSAIEQIEVAGLVAGTNRSIGRVAEVLIPEGLQIGDRVGLAVDMTAPRQCSHPSLESPLPLFNWSAFASDQEEQLAALTGLGVEDSNWRIAVQWAGNIVAVDQPVFDSNLPASFAWLRFDSGSWTVAEQGQCEIGELQRAPFELAPIVLSGDAAPKPDDRVLELAIVVNCAGVTDARTQLEVDVAESRDEVHLAAVAWSPRSRCPDSEDAWITTYVELSDPIGNRVITATQPNPDQRWPSLELPTVLEWQDTLPDAVRSDEEYLSAGGSAYETLPEIEADEVLAAVASVWDAQNTDWRPNILGVVGSVEEPAVFYSDDLIDLPPLEAQNIGVFGAVCFATISEIEAAASEIESLWWTDRADASVDVEISFPRCRLRVDAPDATNGEKALLQQRYGPWLTFP